MAALPNNTNLNLFRPCFVNLKHEFVRKLLIRVDLFLMLCGDTDDYGFLEFNLPSIFCQNFCLFQDCESDFRQTYFWQEMVTFFDKWQTEKKGKSWLTQTESVAFIEKIVNDHWEEITIYPILNVNQTGWLLKKEEKLKNSFITFDFSLQNGLPQSKIIYESKTGNLKSIKIGEKSYGSYKDVENDFYNLYFGSEDYFENDEYTYTYTYTYKYNNKNKYNNKYNDPNGLFYIFLFTIFGTFACTFDLVILYSTIIGEPVKRFSTPLEILPEWYFFSMFSLLHTSNKFLSFLLTASVPGGCFLILFIENITKYQNLFRRSPTGFFIKIVIAIWFSIQADLLIKYFR